MNSITKSPRLDWMNPQSNNFQTVHQATDRDGRRYSITTALSMAGAELVSWLKITCTDDEGKRTTLHQGRYVSTQGSKVAAAAWSKNNSTAAAAVDYLPVAVRAAHRNPESATLWAESIRAQRTVIAYADARLTETDAASVQAAVGIVARLAAIPGSLATTSTATRSEIAKAHIHTLLA